MYWVLHGKPIRLTTRGPANADEERRQLVGWILDEVAFPTLLVATWRVVGHFDGAMYHYWRLMCLARVKTWWREVTTIQLDRLSSVQAAKERARKVVAREHPSHLSVESGEPSRQPCSTDVSVELLPSRFLDERERGDTVEHVARVGVSQPTSETSATR